MKQPVKMSIDEWRKFYPVQDDARNDLNDYIEALKDEYMRHYPENGDSWKTCDVAWLEELTLKAIWEIITPEHILYELNPDHILDISIFFGFLWSRIKMTQDCAALRKDQS